MIRIHLCEEWVPDKKYWRIEFFTTSSYTADRWRRNGVKGHERKFSDFMCYNEQEAEGRGFLTLPEGVNDWSGENQAAK